MTAREIADGRKIVEAWIEMFDPPPQFDFQQSEALQTLIESALLAAERRGIERAAGVASKRAKMWSPSLLDGSDDREREAEYIAAAILALAPEGDAIPSPPKATE